MKVQRPFQEVFRKTKLAYMTPMCFVIIARKQMNEQVCTKDALLTFEVS